MPLHDEPVFELAQPTAVAAGRSRGGLGWALLAFVLSLASLFVVIENASNEPYVAYRRYDVFVQLGAGASLIALWCSTGFTILARMILRRLSFRWLAIPLLAAFSVFALGKSALGYLDDLERFVLAAPAHDARASHHVP